jgi:hypothetical protein
VRTESLETQGGLKWVLRCLVPDTRSLGESERFLGSNEWRDFGFEFEVPEACRMQEIRLESAGKRPFEHKIDGGAWFDRLAVRRVSTPTVSAEGLQGSSLSGVYLWPLPATVGRERDRCHVL